MGREGGDPAGESPAARAIRLEKEDHAWTGVWQQVGGERGGDAPRERGVEGRDVTGRGGVEARPLRGRMLYTGRSPRRRGDSRRQRYDRDRGQHHDRRRSGVTSISGHGRLRCGKDDPPRNELFAPAEIAQACYGVAVVSSPMRISFGVTVEASIAAIVSRTDSAFWSFRCGGKSFSSLSKYCASLFRSGMTACAWVP